MSNNLDKFEKELKNIVEGYEPKYNPRAWGKLRGELNSGYSKWYYLAAGLAAVAVSSMVYLQLNTNNPSVEKQNNTQITKLHSNSKTHVELIQEKEKLYSEDLNADAEKKSGATKQHVKESFAQNSQNKSDDKLFSQDTLKENNISDTKEKQPVYVENENLQKEQTPDLLSPKIVLSKKSGCQPLTVDFSVSDLPPNAKVKWIFSDGFISNSNKVHHQFKNSGTYTVKLDVETLSKEMTLEEKVFVKKAPTADFKYTVNNGVLELENLSSDFEKVQWLISGKKISNENPVFQLQYSADYPVTMEVTNAEACSSTKQKIVSYKVDHHIFAPNAFSPDGDGVNDEFYVRYEPQKGYSYTFQVFNALGEKLFESKDDNRAWNGKTSNSTSSVKREKFLWRLVIEDIRGKKEIKEGYFERLKH